MLLTWHTGILTRRIRSENRVDVRWKDYKNGVLQMWHTKRGRKHTRRKDFHARFCYLRTSCALKPNTMRHDLKLVVVSIIALFPLLVSSGDPERVAINLHDSKVPSFFVPESKGSSSLFGKGSSQTCLNSSAIDSCCLCINHSRFSDKNLQ